MEALIPIINKLQDVLNTTGLDTFHLPQIVVIGPQSSGKSSVIESLVGKSFLPVGNGIVTRRPLILQLIYCHKNVQNERTSVVNTMNLEDWGVFLHKKSKIYHDFDEIRKEIEKETDKLAGNNKNFCSEPINLKIYSSNVANMTLIDLPGIIKVPVRDQPENIESQIKDLALKYISNPNSIILAVVTANTDMTTSESLKIAKNVDPDGRRTITVVTKLDLMNVGTNIIEVLYGHVIPIKLGIIGVVNRSQQDIKNNKSLQDALKDEESFLQSKYPTLATRNGTSYLIKTLNLLLMHHIKDCLPDLKTRVNLLKKQLQSLINLFGEEIYDKNKTLLQIITKFSNAYCQTIEGTARNIETTELCGGARICYIFHEIFGRTLNLIRPLTGLTKMDILTAIRNANGTRPALFVSEGSFELLIKRQIRQLEEPSLKCVELIHEELQRITQHCGSEVHLEMLRFPKLYERIVDIVTQFLRRRIPIANAMIEDLIKIELAYINTNHPDFSKEIPVAPIKIKSRFGPNKPKNIYTRHSDNEANTNMKSKQAATTFWLSNSVSRTYDSVPSAIAGGSAIVDDEYSSINRSNSRRILNSTKPINLPSQVLLNSRNRKFTDSEEHDCEVIEKLIESYFYVVRKSIQDTVPKAVMHFLVNFVKDNLQSELVTHLYKANNADQLLNEPVQIGQRRQEAVDMLTALQRASHIISEIREMQIYT